MKKILVAGCGGAPSEGVINSLLACDSGDEIIGMGSEPSDIILSSAKRKYLVPYANEANYKKELIKILNHEKPDLIHFQNDLEIFEASKIRDDIQKKGTKIFMPTHDVIDLCVNKYKTYLKWEDAGIKVPRTILIENEDTLKSGMRELGDEQGRVWLRSTEIGGGGKGALPTNDFEFAKRWIQKFNGWGNFTAAEMLTSSTVTWLSIWHEGELIVAQTRKRKEWAYGNRRLSGVTGITKVGETSSEQYVTDIAIESINAVDDRPHGVYGVDMTYDHTGVPNPTEINISRFFTTILFFTEAGLNMPKIFKDIAIHNKFPTLETKINPLKDGLLWVRGMDTKPRLIEENEIEEEFIIL